MACNCLFGIFGRKPPVIKASWRCRNLIGYSSRIGANPTETSSRIISEKPVNLKGPTANTHSFTSQSRGSKPIDLFLRSDLKLKSPRLEVQKRGHRIRTLLSQRPGYERKRQLLPRSCHRDRAFGKRPRRKWIRIPTKFLTTNLGVPEGKLIQRRSHASRDAHEEILESPSICDPIHTVPDAAQKSSAGNSALRVCCWSGDIHTLAGHRWFRRNTFRDAASGDSDGDRSEQL